MKQIKRGRGPSAMGGIGSVFGALFGILWTGAAISMGAPVFFVLFGCLFVIMGIVQAVYQFRNAAGENRFSEYDIVEGEEEKDPMEEILEQHIWDRREKQGEGEDRKKETENAEGNFCPYCGARIKEDYQYCRHCGKKIR